MQCMAARCLRQSGTYSEPFAPLRSIVQGLRGGTRFAKCATCHIMHRPTTVHVGMSQRLWIDDPSQSIKSTSETMRNKLVRCLVDTCRSMQRAGLSISPKS
eukprot:7329352-Pyramimonas_sp.AAC.1